MWGEYDSETDTFDLGEEGVLTQITAIRDLEGKEHLALGRYIVPFMQAVVERELCSAREQLLEKVQVAVAAPPPESKMGTALDYGVLTPLHQHTIGLPGDISVEAAEEAYEGADCRLP